MVDKPFSSLTAKRHVLAETRELPSVLRAVLLLEAWTDIEVLQHAAWLGPLLVAALLRQEGLAASNLACLHLGAKNIPRREGEHAIAAIGYSLPLMASTRRRWPALRSTTG